jgi:hypothetical protein
MKMNKKLVFVLPLVVIVTLFISVDRAPVFCEEGLRCFHILGCIGLWGCEGPGLEIDPCMLCCDGDGEPEVTCKIAG